MEDIYMMTDALIQSKIGARLRTLRLKQNIKQESLWETAIVSLSMVKWVKKGEIRSFDVLLRLLRTLGQLEVFLPLVEEQMVDVARADRTWHRACTSYDASERRTYLLLLALTARLLRRYSYEQAFNVMRALRLPYSAAQEMFWRMVFDVVVRNQDDHTKNILFLIGEDGRWRLSPAYYMGYAYNPNGGWTDVNYFILRRGILTLLTGW